MTTSVLADSSPSSRQIHRRTTWSLSIISGLAVLLCAVHGLGMDVDSTGYLAAAVNLAHGRGLTGIGQGAFTLFGPALPSFVSLGVRLGMSAQTTDLILNVLSAVLTVILGRTLLMRHVADRRLVFGGSVLIAIGWPLVQVTSLAITEPLTIVVLLTLVLVLEDFHDTLRPIVSLAVVVLLLNLGFFLRYAGLAFVPAAIVVVFVSRKNIDCLLRRSLYTIATTLLSLLGPCLWMVRNHSVDGSFLGPRYPPVFGVLTVAHQYVLAIAKMFLPGPDIVEDVVFVAVVLLTIVALRLVYRSGSGGVSMFIRRLGPWAVLLVAAVTYVLYLYAAELSTAIDPIDSRLLVPIYVPCVVLLVGLVDAVLSSHSLSNKSKQYTRLALVVFLCGQVLISLALVGDFALEGREFTATPWRTSPLVAASKTLVGVTAYYTNNPSGLWARLGEENIFALPESVSQARKDLSCPGARVVFFTAPPGVYYGGSNAVTSQISSVTLKTLKTELNEKSIFVDSQGELLRPAKNMSARPHCR